MEEDQAMQRNGSPVTSSSRLVWPVHVEVRLRSDARTSHETLERLVHQHLLDDHSEIYLPSTLSGWENNAVLKKNLEKIAVSSSAHTNKPLPTSDCLFRIHVYELSEDQPFDRVSTNPSDASEEITSASETVLPSQQLEGLWESLYYEPDIKSKLLDYIYSTIHFSDADVDHHLVSWNRVVLLHGPPGTGKTSLCRALAQKLSIRLHKRYSHTKLLEINSHSLFSRWFSESGKLVQNLFANVMQLVEEEEDFIVLLIDEVESLTAARASAMAGTEPSDALRVVNALLTQIDKLKYKKNVLVMATSNLVQAIDDAFVDRADIVEYVGYPPTEAVYEILRSCLLELIKRGVIAPVDVPSPERAVLFYRTAPELDQNARLPRTSSLLSDTSSPADPTTDPEERARQAAILLYSLAEKCKGISGRSLRRLPVLANARYIGGMPIIIHSGQVNGDLTSKSRNGRNNIHDGSPTTATEVEVWLDAMAKVVEFENANRKKLTTSSTH